MVGSGESPGIMPLCMIDLLSRIQQEKRDKDLLVKVSYIEIYNENIKDLLISEGIAISIILDRNF